MSEQAERYRMAKAIFLRAMQQEPQARADFVVEASAGDAALQAEVEALLSDERTNASLLDHVDVAPEAPRLPPGYRFLRELGRGGMGVVWLAERDIGDFRQKVAVKLMGQDAMRDPDRRARFRGERRILANLDHPHIARLIDGGMLADGTPYLAMEYVEGERLDLWAERAKPNLRDLLRLFIAICRAVQAAHQRLIVHRDLKPANILVDAYGGPKLLDFGIAKLLDDSAEVELATGTGMQLLTPRYAAPEQVRGETITTATDVYALGVMLYELLTGTSPYGRVSAAPDQLRAICDTDPIRPSAAIRSENTTAAIGKGTNLRGDLDAILLKCLRKSPSARYRGAAELADDLEAFLDGRPVTARAGSTRYALGKFIQRHRYLVASMVAVFAVLVAASILLGVQLRITQHERDIAAREREKAEQVSDFFTDLLRNADPARGGGKDVSIRTALQHGEQALEHQLLHLPETRANLFAQLARIEVSLGDGERALQLADQALHVAKEVDPIDPAILRELQMARASALVRLSRGPEAGPVLRTIEREAIAPEEADLRIEATLGLGNLAADVLDQREALRWFGKARKRLFAALGVDSYVAAARIQLNEANRRMLGRLSEAGQGECRTHSAANDVKTAWNVCSAVAELKRSVYPADHPTHLSTAGTLATIAFVRGDTEGALNLRRDIADRTLKIYGDKHVLSGYALFNLAVSLDGSGDKGAAEPMYQRALEIVQAALGATHRSTLVVRNNLANLHFETGRVNEALREHREILELRRQSLGAEHGDVAQSLSNLAKAEVANDQVASGLAHASEAVAMQRRLSGNRHRSTALALLELAQLECDLGRFTYALKYAEEASSIYVEVQDAPDELAATRFVIARSLWEIGDRKKVFDVVRLLEAEYKRFPNSKAFLETVEEWRKGHPAR